MKQYFYNLADFGTKQLTSGEVLLLNLDGEDSQFCRFNHNRIRQAGDISDRSLTITLINGSRHSSVSVVLTRDDAADRRILNSHIDQLRQVINILPGDPHFLYSRELKSSENVAVNKLPNSRQMATDIMAETDGLDMVGHLASGAIFRGFANSLGQRNWYEKYTFGFDWSAYLHSDKAVKSAYAGVNWDRAALHEQVVQVRSHLGNLAKTPKTLVPGNYRIYLAPAALSEVIGTLSWGGFSEKAIRTKQSSLLQLVDGSKQFHRSVSLSDDREAGLAPNFDSYGFAVEPRVGLITEGRYQGSLISPRTAKEFALVPNSAGEMPVAISLAAGGIKQSDVLQTLGTGIYINNLWYLNYSDRSSCKLTGMTRFASFWVEDGHIVAPINVMRFDDSAYNLLGEHLIGLTSEREFILSSSTYERRSVSSEYLPGAIIDQCCFTL